MREARIDDRFTALHGGLKCHVRVDDRWCPVHVFSDRMAIEEAPADNANDYGAMVVFEDHGAEKYVYTRETKPELLAANPHIVEVRR